MAGEHAAAKQMKFVSGETDLSGVSARAAKARVGLQLIDDRNEIIEPDYPFELKPRAVITRPHHIGFDPANHREANDDAVAALQLPDTIDHKAVRRKVADVQMQIAVHKMLDYSRKIDRVARCTAQIGNTEISSTSHVLRSFRPHWSRSERCRIKADNW